MRRRVDASGNRRKELRPLAFTFPTRGRLGRIHPNFSLLGFSAALAPKFDARDSKSALCPKHFQEADHTCAKVPSSALESGSAAARAWARPRGEGGQFAEARQAPRREQAPGPRVESGRSFAEARPHPACWRSEFAKNAYFAEARPLEPMKSAAAAAPGRLQVPKSAPGSRENALEARFGGAARDFQPKMPPFSSTVGQFWLKKAVLFPNGKLNMKITVLHRGIP